MSQSWLKGTQSYFYNILINAHVQKYVAKKIFTQVKYTSYHPRFVVYIPESIFLHSVKSKKVLEKQFMATKKKTGPSHIFSQQDAI